MAAAAVHTDLQTLDVAPSTDSEIEPRNFDRVGRYHVLSTEIASGGFCSVYPCKCLNSKGDTVNVAVKLSKQRVDNYDNDPWRSQRREWQTYQALGFGRTAEAQAVGIPAVYECGLVKTIEGGNTYTWMSMQLLGSDLGKLAQQKRICLESNFLPLATGMLAALEHMHSRGLVHNDVKTANFCLADRDADCEKVFVVDFGFTRDLPSREHNDSYHYVPFYGTADYASNDALNGMRCSAKDDLESLGYCYLEMLQYDLPWYLTKAGYLTKEEMSAKEKNLSKEENVTRADNVAEELGHQDSIISEEELSGMAERREQHWEELRAAGKIPPFLIHWQKYVRGLNMFDTASYAWLRLLLGKSQQAVPKPAKRSREDVAAEDLEIDLAQKKQKANGFDLLHNPEE